MPESENKLLQKGDSSSKVYELGYLLAPTIAETEVLAAYGNLKDLVMSLHGEIITDEIPRMMGLAYPMQKVISNMRHKFNTAYFGWTKFAMDSGKILELKKTLDLDPNFVRFLILKTVKENTIAAKRFIRGDASYRKSVLKRNDNEPVVPIDKEEVDKEIDALIAV